MEWRIAKTANRERDSHNRSNALDPAELTRHRPYATVISQTIDNSWGFFPKDRRSGRPEMRTGDTV